MPDRVTRLLTADDIDASINLAVEAFGTFPAGTLLPTPADFPPPGRHSWGTFEDGRLLARVMGREYDSWFHGRAVPTCGIAGVAVVAEHRGEGLLSDLMRATLDEAGDRGEAVSTLFPTAPGIYRAFGYELVGSYDAVEVPTGELGAVRRPAGTVARRATANDFDTVRDLYDRWASEQNGPLTRRGVSFPTSAEEFVAAFTGVTVAVDETGEVVGYCSWDRGTGYDKSATIEVADLIAVTADGYRALWRVLGSYSTVTGQVRVHTSGDDLARLVLPGASWQVTRRHPYMLRVHDVAGALTGIATTHEVDLTFGVTGDRLGAADGDYRLRVVAGRTVCEPAVAGAVSPVLDVRGLALAYAGAQSTANLRMAGLLTGPATHDAAIDTLLGGRQVHIRDYF